MLGDGMQEREEVEEEDTMLDRKERMQCCAELVKLLRKIRDLADGQETIIVVGGDDRLGKHADVELEDTSNRLGCHVERRISERVET